MDDIRQYILSVTAAAILSGIVIGLIGNKGSYGAIVKLLCGLFLVITAVAPWMDIRINELMTFTEFVQSDSIAAAASGEAMAYEAAAAIIKSRSEAYILDKATAMGLDITAEITLTESDPPMPCGVKLTGAASPYAKSRLAQYIANDLGIPEDEQIWT